jgi:hypothetical protein
MMKLRLQYSIQSEIFQRAQLILRSTACFSSNATQNVQQLRKSSPGFHPWRQGLGERGPTSYLQLIHYRRMRMALKTAAFILMISKCCCSLIWQQFSCCPAGRPSVISDHAVVSNCQHQVVMNKHLFYVVVENLYQITSFQLLCQHLSPGLSLIATLISTANTNCLIFTQSLYFLSFGYPEA